jgi:hypothetical protein
MQKFYAMRKKHQFYAEECDRERNANFMAVDVNID